MARYHKHKGVLDSRNYPRMHSVDVQHKDTYAKRCHNLEINVYNSKKGKTPIKKDAVKNAKEIFTPKLNVSIDKDNYLFIDLTKNIPQKGIRVKFQRQESNKKKTVGIQIEK